MPAGENLHARLCSTAMEFPDMSLHYRAGGVAVEVAGPGRASAAARGGACQGELHKRGHNARRGE